MKYPALNEATVTTLQDPLHPQIPCYQCNYWHMLSPNAGECRRFAPTPKDNTVGEWPRTHILSWCGEAKYRTGYTTDYFTNERSLEWIDLED